MTDPSQQELRAAAAAFAIDGQFRHGEPYGSGHINATCQMHFAGAEHPRYLFQRINRHVFRDVPALMANIARVTAHLRASIAAAGGDPDREGLTLVPTRHGDSFWRSPAGDCWRCYLFIEGARTYDVITDTRQAVEAARAFGDFQRQLADLPGPPLTETIVAFHHTPRRLEQLAAAIAEDPCKRAADCRAELAWALDQEALAHAIADDLEAGRLPRRTTHNDTKINNVMLDDASGRAVCVIDLDTVMPGSVLHDFGDQVRSAAGHFAENTRDLAEVRLDLDRFAGLARGYLAAAGELLTDRELALLPVAGMVMTYECGLRFLADHLAGDRYFRIHRPGENLDRARTQFAFVRAMQDRRDALAAIVADARESSS